LFVDHCTMAYFCAPESPTALLALSFPLASLDNKMLFETFIAFVLGDKYYILASRFSSTSTTTVLSRINSFSNRIHVCFDWKLRTYLINFPTAIMAFLMPDTEVITLEEIIW